jgi:hypothetical protein
VLSPRDIFAVLQAQSDSPDVRFGDLAVDMGLMTRAQLTRLLMIQADRKRPITEILVGQGALTAQKAASELTAYRRSQLRRPRASAGLKVAMHSRMRATPTRRSDERITV